MAGRRTSATEDETPPIAPDLSKADISIPAPGIRFHVLKRDPSEDMPEQLTSKLTRENKASIHYEMFRQHPTIRAAIEKVAKVAVSTGYAFNSDPPGEKVDDAKRKDLRLFFRKSNAAQLLRLTYKDLMIFGDAYWWIERARNGKPIRAMRLHPAFVDIKTSNGKVKEYRYSVGADQRDVKTYKPERIIHFKLDDPSSDLYGMSLLESLQGVVAVDLNALRFNGKFFENSAQTGTVFSLKSTDAGEIERNREYLEQNYVGTDNAHKPLLLEGDVKVEKSVSTPQEMQFIEGRKMLREEMLEVLDVPKEKLGITEDSNRSTGKESDNTFRSEAIAPLQSIVEEEVNNRLILEMFGWDDIVFSHNEVSTRDSLEMMKLLAESERMGVLSINEIRDRQFGLPGTEGGDAHFVQTAAGLIPLKFLDDIAARMMMPGGDAFGNNPPGWVPPAPSAGKEGQRDTFDPSAPAIGDLRGGEGEGG
jgi:HK97 family phage portal protein